MPDGLECSAVVPAVVNVIRRAIAGARPIRMRQHRSLTGAVPQSSA
jgi:RecJ-like exonuclease